MQMFSANMFSLQQHPRGFAKILLKDSAVRLSLTILDWEGRELAPNENGDSANTDSLSLNLPPPILHTQAKLSTRQSPFWG